ncbi:2-nitropropane dioxygenase [Scheffersomyces coipomensis]|uniref:2-nitropropane dioxygenase n=1 Tax=Scheffersomyces coipomensis TaxID=1788519 RepID=UPI00315DF127
MSKSVGFCKRLGLKYPIIQAPMAGTSTVELATEITNNGGLGSLPISTINFTQSQGLIQLKSLIEKYNVLNKSITNLNFFCHEIVEGVTPTQIKNWFELYSKVLNVNVGDVSEDEYFKNGNISFKEYEHNEELIDYLTKELKPAVISFHFGYPSKETILKFQAAGIQIWVTSTSLQETEILGKLGVDGIVCQGFEAGGHRGNFITSKDFDENLSTLALFLKSKQYLHQHDLHDKIDLIPTGGIMDSKTVKFYLDSDASAVQVGTVFLTSPEITNNKSYLKSLLQSHDYKPTILIDIVSGKRARAIQTDFIKGLIKYNHPSDDLPPYGILYNAYRTLKSNKTLSTSLDIGFYLMGQNYFQTDLTLTSTKDIFQSLVKDL